jgi:hypothetical protein
MPAPVSRDKALPVKPYRDLRRSYKERSWIITIKPNSSTRPTHTHRPAAFRNSDRNRQ